MIVTRFAPSPTGYLHVGGARTALYSWLHARRSGGKFILRIEDTDQERSDPAMSEAILDSMRWLGLDWDEGPFYQSRRREIYDELFQKLLAADLAYESEGAIRLRLSPEPTTIVHDLLHGDVAFGADVVGELVIRKSDGFPTFHFAVAADDALMGVTDVIRGDDHLSNSPKQIRILEALEKATGDEHFRAPRYAHLPLILGQDGKRFSKRHGATAVGEYRTRGYLPDALTNFLALLGWSPGGDREIVTREEMIALFDIAKVNLHGAVFDEVKLGWMNGKYLAARPISEVLDALEKDLEPFSITREKLLAWGIDVNPRDWLCAVVGYGRERARVISEIIGEVRYFLEDEITMDPESAAKHLKGDDLMARLRSGRDAIAAATPWSVETLESEIRGRAEAAGFKPPKVMHPLRVATTGRAFSPGLFETIYYIGRARALKRIDQTLAR